MSYKTKAERASEKAFDVAREAWCAEIRAQGKRTVSQDEYDRFVDVRMSLTLALRRLFPYDSTRLALSKRLHVLYEEVDAEVGKMVLYNSFRLEGLAAMPPKTLPDLELVITETPEEAEA